MTADVFLRYLLVFLAGVTFGASGLYLLLRGFLAGMGRAMPFRDDRTRDYVPTNTRSSRQGYDFGR